MRFMRVVLALVFGLAVAGPETHACPVHSAAPGHHQQSSDHQKAGHCTCPQACCPVSAAVVLLPSTSSSWAPEPLPIRAVALEQVRTSVLPSRQHLLPFALAPPHTLA